MQVVELDIELLDMPYRVARRLRVPLSIRLSQLHTLLQVAMPWENAHHYDFALGRSPRWTKRQPGGRGNNRDVRKESLADVLAELGRNKSFLYTYDMGDSWEHEITPAKPRDLGPGEAAIALLSALGTCPPEDSGGAPGFDRLLRVAADPVDKEHEDILDWLGDLHPWNPAADEPSLAAAVRKASARVLKSI